MSPGSLNLLGFLIVPTRLLRRRLFLATGLWAFLSSAALAQSDAPVNLIPSSRQIIYAPTAGIKGFDASDLAIVNRTSSSIAVTPTVYSLEGNPFPTTQISLNAYEVRHVDVKTLVPEEMWHRALGGISLDFFGSQMGVAAQLTISGSHGFGNFDETLLPDMNFTSNDSDAVWWEPQGAHSFVILGNSSAFTVHAEWTSHSGQTNQVDIPAHATLLQPLSPGGAGFNSIHVLGFGSPGALRVSGYVSSRGKGYLDTIRAYDPASASEAATYANGLHFSSSDSHLTVKNVSANPITVSGTLYLVSPKAADKTLQIAPKLLAPGSSQPLDLPTSTDPELLDGAALKLESSGPVASFVASYVSHNAPNRLTRSVPFKDIGDMSVSTGVYPWRLDGGYRSTVFITNVGKVRAAFIIWIRPLNDSTFYYVAPIYLEVGESRAFDLRRIRDAQTPDNNGVHLPKNTVAGQFGWSTVLGDGSQRLIGRNEIVDLDGGVSASFSCAACSCPLAQPSAALNPSSVTVAVGSSASIGVNATQVDPCNRNPNPPLLPINGGPWTITTSNIFTLSSGAISTLTGVSPGSSGFSMQFTPTNYAWNGQSCFTPPPNPPFPITLTGSGNVACQPVVVAPAQTPHCDGTTIYHAGLQVGGTDYPHVSKITVSVGTNASLLIELIGQPYVDNVCSNSAQTCFRQDYRAHPNVSPPSGNLVWDVKIYCHNPNASTPDYEVPRMQSVACQ